MTYSNDSLLLRNEQLKGYMAGICSGVAKWFVGHPLDTIKIRLQTSPDKFNGVIDCIGKTFKNEGIRGFYKGSVPPLMGWVLMDSVSLGSLRFYKQLIREHYNSSGGELSYFQHGIAGLFSGWTVSLVATPVELLKGQLQVQYGSKHESRFKGPVHVVKHILKQNGIFGLWRGFAGCALFRTNFFVLWSSYAYYSDYLNGMNIAPQLVYLFAGGMAANTFWIMSFPADVLKNKVMTSDLSKPPPKLTQVAKDIYLKQGWRGFYRGFVPCLIRSFPTNASALFVYEMVMRYV
ncbi:hypothetical protein MP638_004125 [Amoeboaphelidium occidentale]|nr:hypothetical protein MP638_004125 [Amoeboaphelidium occidentale]